MPVVADDAAAAFAQAAGLVDVRLAGDGLEFTVYRAKSPRYSGLDGDVALRVPKCDIFSNVNDPHLSGKGLLQQELAIYSLLASSAVPVPRPYELLEAGGKVAMLAQYIESDGSPPFPEALGRGLAQLHLVSLPTGFTTVACEGCDVLTVLPRRIIHRPAEFRKFDPQPRSQLPDTLSEDVFRSSITGPEAVSPVASSYGLETGQSSNQRRRGNGRGRLLQRPCRPAGCRDLSGVRAPRPGPGVPSELRGAHPRAGCVSQAEELCLRLDAAVMTALVFLSEAPDAQLAATRTLRVRELYLELEEEILGQLA
jgi:hypothetical protein